MHSGKTITESYSENSSGHSGVRKLLHRFVPSNFNNIIGLTRRLIFEGKPAGRIAMFYSILGLVLTPLDVFLGFFERRLYRSAQKSKLPQIFVCGAPRSGTTVAAQTFIRHLPVYYFNNLTSLFPRAPIMANKLFGWMLSDKQHELPLESFYGRTTRLSFPNDALYIWDRWTGPDRKNIPEAFSPETEKDLACFFNAVEDFSGKPLLNKNNSLNTYAHLAARALPNAYFICLDRDPLYLAQSHYVARKFIHGDLHVSYGIEGKSSQTEDPIEGICRQVLFHKERIRQQQQQIGPDRFIIMPYEDFCERPAYWIAKISEQVLGNQLDPTDLKRELPALKAANERKIDVAVMQKIERTLDRMKKN